LYFKFSIITVESVNIKCNYSYQGKDYSQPYVLYYRKYKSFQDALQIVQKITTKYKILNGDLESPENYEELKLEDCILPYREEERCSVCFENTTDTTVCDHYICFNCREKCILKKQLNCPICRNANIMHLYNNILQLFNNRDSYELSCIFLNSSYKYSFDVDNEEISESESEPDSDSDSEEEDIEESNQVNNVLTDDNRMDVEESNPANSGVIDDVEESNPANSVVIEDNRMDVEESSQVNSVVNDIIEETDQMN
jgi:hypothetical protein